MQDSQIRSFAEFEFALRFPNLCLLERGDATLGDSMALFEEGTKLVNACRKELDTAEQKVVKLSKGPDDAPVEHDFAAED